MSSDIEKLARYARRIGYKEGARRLTDYGKLLEKAGQMPTSLGLEIRDGKVQETREAKVEIRRFSDEARQALLAEGYVIYYILPKSITQMLEEDASFGYVNPSENLRRLIPRATEAAVNPANLAIEDSNRQTLDGQRAMIRKFGSNLARRIKGVKAIMADAPVYCQLDFEHQRQTGEKLLVGLHARTPTKTVGSSVAYVGRDGPDDRLYVAGWLRGLGHGRVWAVPVVVPK